jgi:hypothetical protein
MAEPLCGKLLVLCRIQQMLQVEKVVKVLKPGPVGVKEHKYSDGELKAARAVAEKAKENWSQISKQS